MEAHQQAVKVFNSIHYDFRDFTIDGFIQWIEGVKGRKILTFEWQMPAGLFGAWMSDGEEPKEYIFYRKGVPDIHRIHIILHELAHLLLGHPTVMITRAMVVNSYKGLEDLPFLEYARLRSPKMDDDEIGAETLASLMQERVIRHAQLAQLTSRLSTDEWIAQFLRDLGIAE